MRCNVSHFRIFGCIAYAHVPKQLRKNIDDGSEKCIFLGYGEETKHYKLYNPITKRLSSVEMCCSRRKIHGME